MADMKELIAKRGILKAQLTKFTTFVNELANNQTKIGELRPRLIKLEQVWSGFGDIQTQIELMDETDAQSAERDSFENKYFAVVAQAEPYLHSTQFSAQVSDVQRNIVLPKIKLPEFSGAYDMWYNFYDTFKSLIHDDTKLSNIQKFHYLQAALKGEAAQIIHSLEISDANYDMAWTLLKSRFENKKVIIRTHIKHIFELPNVTKGSQSSLREFLDKFQKHFQSLKNLKLPVDKWDEILIYLLTSKLDPNSKKEWEIHSNDIESPQINQFSEFISKRCQLLESMDNKTTQNITHRKQDFKPQTYSTVDRPISCPFCKENHFIHSCKKFLELTPQARYSEVKRLRLCSNCLRRGHSTKECYSRTCSTCNKKHNSLLHFENNSQAQIHKQTQLNAQSDIHSVNHAFITENTIQENLQPPTISTHCNESSSSFILLSTAVIYIYDFQGNPIKCRALLDSGSQSNFLTRELYKKLNLKSISINLPVMGINSSLTNISQKTQAKIQSIHNNYNVTISLLIIDKITESIPQLTFKRSAFNIPSNIKLADPNFYDSRQIDVLLGASIFYELMCVGQIKLGHNQPILQKSTFGWIVSGPMNTCLVPNSHCHLTTNSEINKQLERFWIIEQGSTEKMYTQEESECEQHFLDNFSRDQVTGRFSVKLPLRDNYLSLGDSQETAIKRFYSIERKLLKDSQLRLQYNDFMNEYKLLGHMSEINPNCDQDKITFYFPHHCVKNELSLTTKLRVVFDGSCKTSSNLSINDVLKVGPVIQEDLVSLLTRFRKHNIVIKADIAKMYRQIEIHPDHRNLQRIVWRSDPSEPLTHFQLNTVTYGTSSAPFLAIRCLQQVAKESQEKYPTASQVILHDFYVDDLITGTSDEESAKTLIQDLTTILNNACFDLRKWTSNNVHIFSNQNTSNLENYIISDGESCKTLGVLWNAKQDIFQYTTNPQSHNKKNITKRQILSIISKIFDPLGLVGPVTIKAKVILQQLWLLKLSWDESLPLELFTKWNNFYSQLPLLDGITIPRQIMVSKPINIQIHAFSDASLIGFGSSVYMRSVDSSSQILVRLITAKSRVAPLKSITVPRLELSAALLMAQLVNKVISALHISINEVHYWTDSTIVLSWLATEPGKLKTFVSHRVAEIQQLSEISQWHHIASGDNPADIISRGLNPAELSKSSLWWHGPSWLQQEAIPYYEYEPINSIDVPESRVTHACITPIGSDIFKRYSSILKLQRITAYCLRFKANLTINLKSKNLGKLTLDELNKSDIRLIQLAQNQEFLIELHALSNKQSVPKNSKLNSLDPFLDDHGLIRVGGRLKNSNLKFDHKYPIVLPAKHPLTTLIIRYEHERNFHAGTHATLSNVRAKYWPLNGKQTVRSVLRKCIICFRANPSCIYNKMGDLPTPRVTPTRAFSICGVDYAGPFMIKDSKFRNRKFIKCYICIFICFSTKAAHLELVSDLTTDGFLNALKRFASRRGLCQQIYSDNATNFIGADNEFKRISQIQQTDKFHNYLDENKISWNFIPARSPHFGGLWEAAVKSAKYHIKRVSANANLTFEEFYTLLTQIEAVMNSRPLHPLSSDPNDLEPLTPGHFLIGSALNAVPQENLIDSKISHLSRYRHLQKIVQDIWQRWSRDYLHCLQQRSKWKFEKQIPELLGSLVILKEENRPPQSWHLGRIVALHPGKDNIVRVVSVKTPHGVVKRATVKICVLPID